KGVSSYKSCLVNDMILDKNGQKMSKTKGNSVEPIALMQEFGADAIRWYLLEISPPWVPTRFDVEGVKEILGKFVGTLKNVYSFYATYANIDGFDAAKYPYNWDRSTEIDRWIISRLHSLIKEVRSYTDVYEFTRSVRAIQDFVINEVSNWYVRRSRRRFWAFELTEDKVEAYRTLYMVLLETSKIIAPFTPHLAEELFQNLGAGLSVHLEPYPVSDSAYIDPELENKMQSVIDVVSLGRAARNDCQIKTRQPLGEMFVSGSLQEHLSGMEDLVKEEVNVSLLKYIGEEDSFVQYDLKPDYKVMGPKYGSLLNETKSALQSISGSQALQDIRSNGYLTLNLSSTSLRLGRDDIIVNIIPREGYAFASQKDIFVALDTHKTDALIKEGYARELVNKIQYTRKDLGLEIMDNISLKFAADEEICAAITEHQNYLMSETLCHSLEIVPEPQPGMQQVDINGREVFLGISKIQPNPTADKLRRIT
ncbi:MAG: DUF5915 domain-containing protein, partial [Candidatus Cloacimonetes bacterium]|nr:DUF5915 domain-containing protein [Candidatus Cloacimonadota bacterium]